MTPDGTIVVSVSHTGTRELCRQLGIPLEFHPTTKQPHLHLTDKVWHSHHAVPESDLMVVPARSPLALARSYAARGHDAMKMVHRLDLMEELLRVREHVIVPVDIARVRDVRMLDFGGTRYRWERTGHRDNLPYHEFGTDYQEIVPLMYNYTLFGDYE